MKRLKLSSEATTNRTEVKQEVEEEEEVVTSPEEVPEQTVVNEQTKQAMLISFLAANLK